MDKYIRMLLYKLKGKVKYSVMYMIKYKGEWEQYYSKSEALKRLIEIDKEA